MTKDTKQEMTSLGETEKHVTWKWTHLGSDVREGPNGITGYHLGRNIHYNLQQQGIVAGAQLIQIGDRSVESWDFRAVESYLNQYLRQEHGPLQRKLIFRNQTASQQTNEHSSHQHQTGSQPTNHYRNRLQGYRGRGRRRYKFVKQQYNRSSAPDRTPVHPDSASQSILSGTEEALTAILKELSYPLKAKYSPKDMVWVQYEDSEWRICIIKFVLNETELIVRPLGHSESTERMIHITQINKMPDSINLSTLNDILESMKREIADASHNKPIVNEIFEYSLVQCKDGTFGQVLTKHGPNRYSVKISDECKWYNGAKVITVLRHEIYPIDESELRYKVLEHERKEESQQNEDEQAKSSKSSQYPNNHEIYDFLDDLGDLYTHELISNGITNLDTLLSLKKADLKQMNIKLGHRRYILHKIESFDAEKFRSMQSERQTPKEPNEEANQNTNTEDNIDCANIETNIKLVVYDFEQTVTSLHLYHQLFTKTNGIEADQIKILNDISEERLLGIFRGKQRVLRLRRHFNVLKSVNVDVVIISFGFVKVIKTALKRMNLYNEYSDHITIIGYDSPQLLDAGGSKICCIENTFTKDQKLKTNGIIFVDDDPSEIQAAKDSKLCHVIHVEERNGMKEEHMVRIEAMCALKPGSPSNEENDNNEGFETTHVY